MGTIMVLKDEQTHNISYPSTLGKSEDSVYLQNLRHRADSGVIVWDNPPTYYMRLYHGFNTWNLAHFMIGQKPRDNIWCLQPEIGQDEWQSSCRLADIGVHDQVMSLYIDSGLRQAEDEEEGFEV